MFGSSCRPPSWDDSCAGSWTGSPPELSLRSCAAARGRGPSSEPCSPRFPRRETAAHPRPQTRPLRGAQTSAPSASPRLKPPRCSTRPRAGFSTRSPARAPSWSRSGERQRRGRRAIGPQRVGRQRGDSRSTQRTRRRSGWRRPSSAPRMSAKGTGLGRGGRRDPHRRDAARRGPDVLLGDSTRRSERGLSSMFERARPNPV